MSNDQATLRYSRLAPFDLHQRITLTLKVLEFFSPMQYEKNCVIIGRPPTPGRTEPLDGGELLTFLDRTGTLKDPRKYMHRIGELLANLEASGLLTSYGQGRDIIIGKQYYFFKEYTTLEGKGLLWLSKALGAEFIHYAYSNAVVQITGENKHGDVHAGTGVIINPSWVLTCAHVINDMTIHNDQIFGENTYRVINTLVHPTIDVGLVQFEPVLPAMASLAFRDPNLSESLFTLGFPRVPLSRTAHLVMQRGEVTTADVTLFDGSEVFLYSAIARPGNSGGPIIASSGHIVGIVTEELMEEVEDKPSEETDNSNKPPEKTEKSNKAPVKTKKPIMPFYAGIRTSTIRSAISELEPSITLPIENWQ